MGYSKNLYSGRFMLMATDLSGVESVVENWEGPHPVTEEDIAFWGFRVAILCSLLDAVEAIDAGLTALIIEPDGSLPQPYHSELQLWRETLLPRAFNELLPGLRDIFENMCSRALGRTLRESLSYLDVRFGPSLGSGTMLDPKQQRMQEVTLSYLLRMNVCSSD